MIQNALSFISDAQKVTNKLSDLVGCKYYRVQTRPLNYRSYAAPSVNKRSAVAVGLNTEYLSD